MISDKQTGFARVYHYTNNNAENVIYEFNKAIAVGGEKGNVRPTIIGRSKSAFKNE